MTTLRFDGTIAGFGTGEGTRVVVGSWKTSPFGAFSDVMVERATGERLLLAPTDEVAEFVASTYSFDSVLVTPVSVLRRAARVSVSAGPLRATFDVGGVSPLGRLLRLVPRSFAASPRWLRLIDSAAALLVPGARTAGTAGGGRREFYGVRAARRITACTALWNGESLGDLARLDPPVRFGFGSAPASPQIVSVVTTIVES